MTAPLIMRTADGEAREARTYPDGSYACPFCDAAVMSPDGWAEMQRLNAEHYARTEASVIAWRNARGPMLSVLTRGAVIDGRPVT